MHVLLAAFPAVLRQYPDALCVIVGGRHALEPDVPEMLRQRVESLGLADRVLMVGVQEDVPLWMQAMDVFVHASDREPLGLVVLEAMALGKPVVAGAEGGPCEIITPGQDGMTAPFGDAETIANAVVQYLQDPKRAEAVGRAARARSLLFSIDGFADRLLEALLAAPGRVPVGQRQSCDS
jgi:glycosyltransferase involved in cell wall biosynthesis